MNDFLIRSIQASDRNWVESFIKSHSGSEIIVAKGRVIRPGEVDGFAAFKGKNPVGLLTYRVEGRDCEIITFDSTAEGEGNRNHTHPDRQGNGQSESLQKALAHNYQ